MKNYRIFSIILGFIISNIITFVISIRTGYNKGYIDGAKKAQQLY